MCATQNGRYIRSWVVFDTAYSPDWASRFVETENAQLYKSLITSEWSDIFLLAFCMILGSVSALVVAFM